MEHGSGYEYGYGLQDYQDIEGMDHGKGSKSKVMVGISLHLTDNEGMHDEYLH